MNDLDKIWDLYQEAKIPFDKRRKVRKGMIKKYGKKTFAPFTFGFDIEFYVPVDEDMAREYLESMVNSDDLDSQYREWVESQFDNLEDLEYNDISDWEYDNPEPDHDDYEDPEGNSNEEKYEEDLEEWERRKEEEEEKISDHHGEIEWAYESWQTKFIDHIIYNDEIADYLPHLYDQGSIDYEVENFVDVVKDVMENHEGDGDEEDDLKGWTVDEDEARHVEVASPILTSKDIPMVRDVLDEITHLAESKNHTSAHIHIGVPETFDFFDLMVLYDLVDEDYINKLQPDRKRNYTKLKDSFYKRLVMELNNFEENEPIYIDKLRDIGDDKYMGVNISKVRQVIKKSSTDKKFNTGTGKTIEFRYLSSEIFDSSSGIDEFLEFIDYFMIIIKAAESRNSFKFFDDYYNHRPYTIVRLNRNRVSYHTTDRAIPPNYKPRDIKQTTYIPKKREEYIDMIKEIWGDTTSEFKQANPIPDLKNMSEKGIKNWFLQTPSRANIYITNYPLRKLDEFHDIEDFVDVASKDFIIAHGLPLTHPKTREKIGRMESYEKHLLTDPLGLGNEYMKNFINDYMVHLRYNTNLLKGYPVEYEWGETYEETKKDLKNVIKYLDKSK